MLKVYVIYDRPTDYPKNMVVRAQWPEGEKIVVDKNAYLFNLLDEARDWIASNTRADHCIPRHVSDDPVIVESWI